MHSIDEDKCSNSTSHSNSARQIVDRQVEVLEKGPSALKPLMSKLDFRRNRAPIGGYWAPRGGMPIDVFWQAGKLPKDVWVPDQGVVPYRGRG